MIKCICLIRVSTQQQLLEGQRDKVINAAMSDGYSKSEIEVVEAKESAIKLKEEQRETLNEMKQLIIKYPSIESVYVFAIDRLARKVSTILSVKDYLLEHHVNLVFLNPHRLSTIRIDDKGNKVEDELTSLMLLFLAYGAEMEMKLKQARMKVQKDILRSNNKIASGRPMFGYAKAKDKSVIVDETLGPIVRDIYIDYVEHKLPMYDIYKKYAAQGIFKEKKKSAAKNTIRRILLNKAYCGDYSSDDKIGNIKYPPIITKDMWEATQKLIKEKMKLPKYNHKNIYYGKSKVRLMNTGRIMICHISNVCYKSFEDVKASININAIDSLIWKVTCDLQLLTLGAKYNKDKHDYSKEIEECNKKLDNINILLEKLNDRKRKAFKLYLNGKVDDSIYNEEIKSIETDIQTWNKEIAKIESEIQRYKMKANETGEKPVITQQKLRELDDVERKKLIDELIDEVQVTQNDDLSYDIKIIAMDKHIDETFNELMGNPTWHYYVRGGVMHLIERSDIIEIEISDIIQKRIVNKKS